ncbi:hypothetical protein NX801_30385 [Streptomyces sp. LP05-1]|uniref:Uncharacterized protein n=1 Tax=Streptomyces pyxinae TaxID=2970734 RepID=A0ABT2CQZ9_9ACTN|nr:hypothetical protein [Streptomyces sp. LP05-1]MCS0639867.1 hypothetical protein [Streptomyces sp. LP05-1]
MPDGRIGRPFLQPLQEREGQAENVSTGWLGLYGKRGTALTLTATADGAVRPVIPERPASPAVPRPGRAPVKTSWIMTPSP